MRIFDSKPKVLEGHDIPSIAKYIKSDKCQNIFLMVGAGISTSSGIPDFRSPDTGLYANLARLNLPYPEAVFDISYFQRNPQPFYTLASELYPGSYRPTPSHAFIRLLAERGLLRTCFTQNIDTLERRAGIPADKIVEAHGSFATQRCIRCKKASPDSHIQLHVKDAKVPYCLEPKCGGLIKPDIVFFGEGLPARFGDKVFELGDADLLIIMGTSLTVYPFAGIRDLVPHSCPRILINLDKVGDIGSRTEDVVLLMECDKGVRELCEELGQDWTDDLEKLWKETEGSYTPRTMESKPIVSSTKKGGKHDFLEKEVDRIAKLMEEYTIEQDAAENPEPKVEVREAEQNPEEPVAEGSKVRDEEQQGLPAELQQTTATPGSGSEGEQKIEMANADKVVDDEKIADTGKPTDTGKATEARAEDEVDRKEKSSVLI